MTRPLGCHWVVLYVDSSFQSKDGTITHDFDYKKETSESKGSLGNTTRGRLASVLRLLPGFFLILLIIVLAYYVYTVRIHHE